MKEIKYLAIYLPQYHPIPENDEWWGKGFTEWTNVTKAKPLFKGHYQPILPADLGFYDLRVPEVQEEQAKLAKTYGIDGFIYYQYWFGNKKMLLEKPAEKMLANKKVNIPFCFCWANETWKGIWHGLTESSVLIEQTYPGHDDYMDYFNYLLPFFLDDRYIKIDNKPVFCLYKIKDIPDLDSFLDLFNKLAQENGFDGIYFISVGYTERRIVKDDNRICGAIAAEAFNKIRYNYDPFFSNRFLRHYEFRIKRKMGYTNEVIHRKKPLIIDYKRIIDELDINITNNKVIPCVMPNWDNSARSGQKSLIFHNSNPELWEKHLDNVVKELKKHSENPPFVVIKSWNEWAEGNYLEPDRKYGHKWLEAVKKVKIKNSAE
ncbi:glycoside hydrolase family 99-like domain-containing protein [Epilithonimonas sp.]|uniref:glycosyltransferase WbsX family protein n=1 Tax=Epilithonimonas sp. TaxID=2894511 RepID=UPI00289F5871|nr:glycoside hydrolase family 99-like domain-containing protein [Epilithonimonas sp.]